MHLQAIKVFFVAGLSDVANRCRNVWFFELLNPQNLSACFAERQRHREREMWWRHMLNNNLLPGLKA